MFPQLRYRRLVAGLSQAELAAALGVCRQTINAIERGRRRPSLPLALGLADVLDSSVHELFDRDANRRAFC